MSGKASNFIGNFHGTSWNPLNPDSSFVFIYITLKILGPSKLAILRTLPLRHTGSNPSIGGSKILRECTPTLSVTPFSSSSCTNISRTSVFFWVRKDISKKKERRNMEILDMAYEFILNYEAMRRNASGNRRDFLCSSRQSGEEVK